jgi:hypothetical protein
MCNLPNMPQGSWLHNDYWSFSSSWTALSPYRHWKRVLLLIYERQCYLLCTTRHSLWSIFFHNVLLLSNRVPLLFGRLLHKIIRNRVWIMCDIHSLPDLDTSIVHTICGLSLDLISGKKFYICVYLKFNIFNIMAEVIVDTL